MKGGLQKIGRGMFALSRASHLSHFTTLLLTRLARPLMADATTRVSASFSTGSPLNASVKRVGTHNGSFHCDEALGCFMIRLTDKFSNAEIVRTRDPQVCSLIPPLNPLLSLVAEKMWRRGALYVSQGGKLSDNVANNSYEGGGGEIYQEEKI